MIVALAITIYVLRNTKNDPDDERLRAQQRDYEARKRAENSDPRRG